ncbi:MAG: hypothetical protein IJR50_04030 [Treponema sp.]|nr:hypothetical protein [Treponema sp.]
MRIRITKLLLCAALFATALACASCYQIVFAKIMGEVELRDATVKGRINSIVRYTLGGTECIFVQNGRIYYKQADINYNAGWTEFTNGIEKLSYNYYGDKFDGIYIYKLAANTHYLYAIGTEIVSNKTDGKNIRGPRHLYYYDTPAATWKKMAADVGDSNSTTTTLFCTNTIDAAHREAYIQLDGKVYKLDGTTLNTSVPVSTHGAGASTKSAIYFSGNTYFFDTEASATNERKGGAATHVYRASGSTLQYSSDAVSWSDAASCRSTILSIAVTSNAIILGTYTSGLAKVTNSGGQPGSSTVGFSTNAEAALDAPYEIPAMICIDPEKSEINATLYAAADFKRKDSISGTSYDDICLWAYYASRGNWNRE